MKTTKAQRAIENLINGNIKDAKRLATNISFRRLFDMASNYNLGQQGSHLAAGYLKGVCTWEQWCEHPAHPDQPLQPQTEQTTQ